ncbi:MAG: PepSY-like domain-containing protein [Muribaculaceae bacterium]|nr:PepSY-like domain-containing protein [Muribaculaceae bacterium]
MKRIKFLLLMAMVMTMSLTMSADDDDRVITYDQMPQAAQTFLKQHFAKKVPLVVTADWDDYTIRYESGEKVEFDKKGNWKDIECYSTKVPAAVVPEQINAYLNQNYPGKSVIKLERHRSVYEVKLNNGMEIEFNRNFQVIDVDYDD